MISAIFDTHHAIVGSSGGGKTVTAKAVAEQLLAERRHLAVIDPTGVWYGLRSNAAGDGPGFDIPIFGGPHGDVPLRPADGAAIAGILVDQRISAIVDLSGIHAGADQRVFLQGFVGRLRAKPKGNFHLIVDEADEACPQTARDDIGFRLSEDMIWIAKRGRAAGFVLTIITQRPADIAKAVLSQMQTIVAHQLVDPRDQRAIEDFLKAKGDKATRDQVMASLAELQVGERWIYSPRLQVLERGITPPIATFDSSATPAPGEERAEPRLLAQLDVSAIRSALGPKLHCHDANLHGSVDRLAQLEAENRRLSEMLDYSRARCGGYRDGIGRAITLLEAVLAEPAPSLFIKSSDITDEDRRAIEEMMRQDWREGGKLQVLGIDWGTGESRSTGQETVPPRRTKASGGVPEDAAGGPDAAQPPAAASSSRFDFRGRRALIPLVCVHPAGLTEAQWATLANLTRTGGTWNTYKGALKTAGLVEQGGPLWYATPAGVAAIGGLAGGLMPPPGPDRARFWAKRIPGVARMVDGLIDRWPSFVTRATLGVDIGMTPTGGTFGTYLGRLRTNGLLEEDGKRVRLAAAVMGPAR